MHERFALLLCVGLSAGPALADPGIPLKDAVPHMTVTGEAKADVMPDQADLSLAVMQERQTADAAADVTAKAATEVIAAIKARGVEPGDIHTTFSLAETFDVKKDEKGNVVSRTPRGYQADESITIRLRDIAKVGPLARELIAKGANSFEGVAFSYSKAKQKRRDLDTEAMRDALVQAKTYTDAVGLKLGRVLQIGEDPVEAGDGEADLPSRRAPSVYVVTSIPTEPGVRHLRRTVTVIWEIEGQAR